MFAFRSMSAPMRSLRSYSPMLEYYPITATLRRAAKSLKIVRLARYREAMPSDSAIAARIAIKASGSIVPRIVPSRRFETTVT